MFNEYRNGLVFSGIFHVGVVAIGVFGLPSLTRDLPDIAEPIPVEIVKIDDVNRSKPTPQPEAPREKPKPQQVAAAEPPRAAPAPAAASAADAVPLPDAKPKSKPKPKETRRAVNMASVQPRAKPRPPSKFDATRVAALLDKSIKEDTPDAPVQKDANLDKAVKAVQRSRFQAREATATIAAALSSQVSRCWIIPGGAKGAESLSVRIRMWLNPDGSLARTPQHLDVSRMNRDEFFRIAAEQAMRAVNKCAPYELPKDSYDLWRDVEFNFDPRRMLGG